MIFECLTVIAAAFFIFATGMLCGCRLTKIKTTQRQDNENCLDRSEVNGFTILFYLGSVAVLLVMLGMQIEF